MKKWLFSCVTVAVLVLVPHGRSNAQARDDSLDRTLRVTDSIEQAQAQYILDVPGTSDIDPDEVMEYLNNLDDLATTGMEQIHADPGVSWVEAHAIARSAGYSNLQWNAPPPLNIRGRVSEPLGASAQQGYITGQYLGAPVAYLNQVRAAASALKIGCWEEQYSWEPTFMEHTGGYIMLGKPLVVTNSFRVQQVIVGDYALAFGNGLGFGDGFGNSNVYDAASAVENRSFGLRGSFLNSVQTLRGAAVEVTGGPARVYLFASHRAMDASVVSDTIRTIYSRGVRQTESQLALANAAALNVLGARAELATADTAPLYLKGGASAYELSYDHPYVGSSSNSFLGNRLDVASADVLVIGNKWSATAESALSENDTVHRVAAIMSAVFTPRKHVSFSLMYSHIPQGFQSPFGEALGAGTSAITNLDGYYIGLELEPMKQRLRLNAYAKLESEIIPMNDLFGARKHDYLANAFYQTGHGLNFAVTVRDEQDATVIDSSGAYATVQGETMRVRLEAIYHAEHSRASFRTQVEQARYVLTQKDGGWSASEEVWVPTSWLESEFQIKATRFEMASSSAASMWIYGAGVPGSVSINTLTGLGWRLSLRATLQALTGIVCSAYLAGIEYDAPRVIGSGLSAHTGTSDFTATVQIDVRL